MLIGFHVSFLAMELASFSINRCRLRHPVEKGRATTKL